LRRFTFVLSTLLVGWVATTGTAQDRVWITEYCSSCHQGTEAAAGLDLATLSHDWQDPQVLRTWTRIYDRISNQEMPPADSDQPSAKSRGQFLEELAVQIRKAEGDALAMRPLRRLTRSEYENTIRDLFELPGIALAGELPVDGSAHGFDTNADALDLSHVNLSKYLEAADHILHEAIAQRPEPPVVQTRRISLANRGGFVAHVLMNGDGVLLKNGQPDPEFPPAAEQNHLDQGAHERWGSFRTGSSVGLFRHEDESFSPYFIEHVTIYPGLYRVKTSLWSFQWNRGQMLPGRGTEAARLSVVQLTGDGRGGQHPSYVLGYLDAPADQPMEHEFYVWLNRNEILGFNTASLAPVANYARQGRAMAFEGPGIVIDWLDIEGPLHPVWPPASHRLLLGDLPLQEFTAEDAQSLSPPPRQRIRQLGAGRNRPDPEPGIWTAKSLEPVTDARHLLTSALPRLFRRPVSTETLEQYVQLVELRIAEGDCFENSMRYAYKAALCSPDFLYHYEPAHSIDPFALANRLSYFLWRSSPDERLRQLAQEGTLSEPSVLHAEVERLLKDDRARRFIDDFTGQWLKLRQIASTDPDRKLYPEFSSYLQDSMVAETRDYFAYLVNQNLDASNLVQSDFVMVNQKLAQHYGIDDVTGTAMRAVPLPADCPRGGLLTQASILKITANGTTTSPVPRGAFVLDRLLGQPPEPPPASVAAIEPDVRGATTIRDQLAKHRDHDVCASCHRDIDPPGFALEQFDVIGGARSRYRSIGDGAPADRGSIDPMIPIGFRLGPIVDASGTTADGHTFNGIKEYQALLAQQSDQLLASLGRQMMIYAIGRDLRFSDREHMSQIVNRVLQQGGGLRTLIHEIVASEMFSGRSPVESVWVPDWEKTKGLTAKGSMGHRMMMAEPLDSVIPVRRDLPPTPAVMPRQPFPLNDDAQLTVRVLGWFDDQRVEDFRPLVASIEDAKLARIDSVNSTATFWLNEESDLFRNTTPQQQLERLDQKVRQVTEHTIKLAAFRGDAPSLQAENFRIQGLDCRACSMAVAEVLQSVEGVHWARASFGTGQATAWIDPDQTDREALLERLEQRQVTVVE
jgi:copper chaperone CopZ